MAESATILIPDISGYTEFLTKTELVHSSHIINELLEAILAANEGEFELSEVEGDALLLYRKGNPSKPVRSCGCACACSKASTSRSSSSSGTRYASVVLARRRRT
jgi:hypothetical protein